MPVVRKTRKRYAKKKPYAKKAPTKKAYTHPMTTSRLNASYATSGIALPKSRVTTLHYTEQHNMALGDNLTYMINSAFDPNAAIGGHQPLGYDQWSAMYTKYYVIGAKYKFTMAYDAAVQAAVPAQFVVTLDRNTTPNATWVTNIEHNKGSGQVILPATAEKTVSLEGTFSLKKFFNLSNIKDNHSVGGTISGNPSYPAYVILQSKDFTGAAGAYEFTCQVDIEQTVLWTEPAEVSGS